MRGAWTLARVAGIDIKAHFTFPLVLVVVLLQWAPLGPRGVAFGLVVSAAVFGFVVLHELGHALTAKSFGIPVRTIMLLPIGGVAALEGKPRHAGHELLIALAGPAVNVVLAAGLGALSFLLFGSVDLLPEPNAPLLPRLLGWLTTANIGLALFNLIPAFPMDGGRVLRALLALGLGQQVATKVAVRVGKVLAVLMGAAALVTGNFMLGFIAVMVFFAGGAEGRTEQARAHLQRIGLWRLARPDHLRLSPGDRLADIARLFLGRRYLPVVFGERLLGVLSREALHQALLSEGGGAYVAGVMTRAIPTVELTASLDDAREVMARTHSPVVAVVEDGVYRFLLDLDELTHALTLVPLLDRRVSVG